ncbi:hypothetical protein CG007_02670 [Mesoplasma entomophilum]|uniref:BspA family leucine-rich repeat surface protein n=1 Tax=Mesoplasma entomophilum TaxID=2149 RepID=UPI000D02C313|nr:BspA family leucine-rich repeat surface protein [Mesoplasma entomophilum]AVN60503.1 hypothetical protein CG007_02670 [Mesoplasma entomophilum]
MNKLISFLAATTLTINGVILAVSCNSNLVKGKLEKVHVKTLEKNLQDLLKSKVEEKWAVKDLQDEINQKYGEEQITVEETETEVKKITDGVYNQNWKFIGNGMSNDKSSYIGEITLIHNWKMYKVLAASEIQAAANKVKGDYVTLEAAQTAIENAIINIAGIKSVEFQTNNYHWSNEQVKFSVELDEDYKLDGNNTFTVDIRIGEKETINYNILKQTFEDSVKDGMSDSEVVNALKNIHKPNGVKTISVNKKQPSENDGNAVFEINITIDEDNYIISSTYFEIKVQVDNREIIDTKELSTLLSKLSDLSFNTSTQKDLEKTIEYIIKMNTSSEVFDLIQFSINEGKIIVYPKNNVKYKLSNKIDVKLNGWTNNSKNQSTIYYDNKTETFVAVNFANENEPSVREIDTETIYQIGYNFEGQVPMMPSKIRQINSYLPTGATNLTNMFNQCFEFNQDLSLWDTSNVTSLYGTFHEASKFDGNISNWNTQSVTLMSYTFAKASQFNKDISKWNTEKVTKMDHMFENAHTFNQNLSSWDVYNVINVDDFDIKTESWNLAKPKFDNSKNIEIISSELYSLVNDNEHKNKAWNKEELQQAVDKKYGPGKIIVIIFSLSKNQHLDVEFHEDTWMFSGQWSLSNKKLEYSNSTSIKHNWNVNVVSVSDIQNLLNNFLTEETPENLAIEEYKKFSASGVKVVSSRKVNKDDKFIKVKLELIDSTYKWNDLNFNGEFIVTSDKIVFMKYIDTTRIYQLYDQAVKKVFTVNSNYKFLDLTKSIAYLNLTEEEFNAIEFRLFTFNNVSGIVDIKIKDQYKNYYTLSGGEKRVSYYMAELGRDGLKQETIAEDSKGNIQVYPPTVSLENKNDGIKVYQIGIDYYLEAFVIGRLPENLEKISPYLPIEITSLYSAFFNLKKFNDANVKQWNVSRITNMNATFGGATNFNQDISGWNTANLNSMNNMFKDAINFNQNLGLWNVNKVKLYENFDSNTTSWVLQKPLLGKY